MLSVSISSETVLARLVLATAGDVGRTVFFHSTAQKLHQCQVNAEGFTLARLAATLLRENTHGAAGTELFQALRTFIFMAVNTSQSPSNEEYIAIADICLQHTPILSILITAIRDSLLKLITELAPQGLAVAHTADLGFRTSFETASHSEDITSDFIELNAHSSISLLRRLVLHSDQRLKNLSFTLFRPLLVLVGAANDDLSQASANALLALISVADGGTPQTMPTASSAARMHEDVIRSDDIWEWINSALSSDSAVHRARALSLWLRLLVKRTTAFPTPEILMCAAYWQCIMEPLACGTTEQRRLSLSVLNLSLSMCSEDFDCQYMHFHVKSRKEIEGEYHKFAILYQTIVLGRYLNQVEACIHDMDSFAQNDSKLHRAWLITLLKASIGLTVQDSIRKLIGEWIIRNGTGILRGHTVMAADFLQTSFLPWAASGPLFNASVSTMDRGICTCTHGEDIARVLRELLTAEPSLSQKAILVKSCLAFLAERGERAFSFARAYILEGLVCQYPPGSNILDAESIASIAKISSAGGVQVVVKDYITILCAKLVIHGKDTGSDHVALRALFHSYRQLIHQDNSSNTKTCLSSGTLTDLNVSKTNQQTRGRGNAASEGSALILETRFSKTMTRETFQASLQNSQSCCLQGQGLQAACNYLVYSLGNSTAEDISDIDWTAIFGALWEETEVQDHPRRIIMSLPELILHPKCVGLCRAGTPLTTIISQILQKLQSLCQFRMYAFTPLAHALRRVVLLLPEAVALPLAEFVIEFAKNPPSLKVEFQLEAAMTCKIASDLPHRPYEYYYGQRGGYGYACIFDMLNQMPMPRYLDIGRSIVDGLLDAWIHQKIPPPMFSHWKTTAQLQVIIILSERFRPFLSYREIASYLDTFFLVLAEEPMPRMRYLMEWAIVRMLAYSADRREYILRTLQAQDGRVPKLTASMMKIALMLARLPDSGEDFTTELFRQLIPLSASSKIVIRHEAQWTFPALFQIARERRWLDLTKNAAFERLDAHIRNLDTFKMPPPGRLRDHFDVIEDHHMTMLCQGGYLRIEPSESEKLSKQDFLALYAQDEEEITRLVSAEGTSLPLGDHKADRNPWQGPTVDKRGRRENKFDAEGCSAPLQTKGSAAQDMILQDEQSSSRKRDVIVVASLIDNAYNIGGLSRVGEIFGIKSLQVRELDIVTTKDFTSVAVSSENWLAIEGLEIENIPNYLTRRKLEGYTVIGIEQTNNSVILGHDGWRFPKRVVLVLGSEKYGIDPRLLADMDICVEINQVGRTRSLNVQTAAAVALFEYGRQHP